MLHVRSNLLNHLPYLWGNLEFWEFIQAERVGTWLPAIAILESKQMLQQHVSFFQNSAVSP